MYDNYNFPAGADTPNAPWNKPAVPERDFNVTCSQSLSKTVAITTNNYIPGASGVDYEPDGEGGYYASSLHDEDDTSNTNWSDEYLDNDYHTPLQLIQLFGQFLKERYARGVVFKSPYFTEHLIEECEGWQEDETEFIEG